MRKKKDNLEIEPKEKKSRAKYKCLPELTEMLRQVRLIPPDFQMKLFELVFDDQRLLLREQTGDNNAAPSITEVLNACLEDTPEEFQQYLENLAEVRASPLSSAKPHMAKVYGIHELANAYSEYFEMRMSMFRHMQHVKLEEDLKETYKDEPGMWELAPLGIRTTVVKGDDGKLHITGLAALIGKFDASRLRRCEICNHIFWASYKNSFTCSTPCLNALRQRRHRKTNKEAINFKRRANYDRNKKLKEIRRLSNYTF